MIGADLEERDGPWLRYVPIDVAKPIDVAVDGIDAVIHCAGYAHRPNETPEEQKMFYAVNRDGTRNMLDWCSRNGVGRFLYVGSIASYDWKSADGRPVDEDHPVLLDTHYARSKYEGEQLVAASSLDWRIVRLATVFGEGDRANFSKMASAMKKRIFLVPGKGSARKSVLPVEVAGGLISEFALMDSVPHRLVNMALPDAPSLAGICAAYHEVCGFPPVPHIPVGLLRVVGFGGDLLAKLLGGFPFTSYTLGKLVQTTEVSTARMQTCFPEMEFQAFSDYLETCKDYYISL